MTDRFTISAASMLGLALSSPLSANTCESPDGWQSTRLSGVIHKSERFKRPVGPMHFVLEPIRDGWEIQLTHAAGQDLTIFSPPVRPVETNPRMISGWHFRNQDNTGPNRGDVNAPQYSRRFSFGSMANDPALNPEVVVPLAAEGQEQLAKNELGGFGELLIDDIGLADLDPGQKARAVYLEFSVCLAWNGEVSVSWPDELLAACNLDDHGLTVDGRMAQHGQPAWQEPDVDGDGRPDFAVPVRNSKNLPGIAFCLGNGGFTTAGFAGRIGEHLDPAYFDSVDYWHVDSSREIFPGVAESSPPPAIHGDALLLGKSDSSSVMLFLDVQGHPDSYWQGD